MDHEKLPILKTAKEAILPTRAYADDAGLDLYNLEEFTLPAGEGTVARTGIALALPSGHVGIITDRSSMAKRGLKTAGGIIDAGYRGEIRILLWNLSREPQVLTAGERIAQLLVVPIRTPLPFEVEQLQETPRGERGFGSSGR